MRKYLAPAITVAFFLSIFFLSIKPLTDFDFWTHLKAGQLVLQSGIQQKDVFSYTATGRTWYQNEWLFEVLVYFLYNYIGPWAIQAVIAVFSVLQVFLLYKILQKLFGLKSLSALFVSLLYFVSVYSFLVARPQLPAMTFLLINIFFLLLFVLKNKNLLWITLPITIIWSNTHGSVVINMLVFLEFTIMSLLQTLFAKQKNWHQTKVLFIYSGLTFLCTILPPLGFTQYQLVRFYTHHAAIIRGFIDEWRELGEYTGDFVQFSVCFGIVVGLFGIVNLRHKLNQQALWGIPLLFLPLFSYLAARNTYPGYIGLAILLGWGMSRIFLTKDNKVLAYGGIIAGFIYAGYVFATYYPPPTISYPQASIAFIKNEHLKGHMFHDYDYGGYLLYNLYPQQKVFIDGRADVYACCEMVTMKSLEDKKDLPDADYKHYLDTFWNKYDISFVLAKTQNHNVWQKIGAILANDPNWSLVFWTDEREIFVRHDGKNDKVLDQFAATAATPFGRSVYRKGQQKEALMEYQHMLQIADSAHTRNAIGFIDLQNKQYDNAKKEFEKAIALYPNFESPYMNLGEIYAMNKDYVTAISLYEKALQINPDRKFISIRLRQLHALEQQ